MDYFIIQTKKPIVVTIIAVLTILTISRLMAITFLPTLEMFGGTSPDVWIAPWVSDSILGLLLPIMIYLILKSRGAVVWGVLVVYSAIGAFDYTTGLVTQWLHPLPTETAAATLVFSSLTTTLLFQLTALLLLFRQDVIAYFIKTN